MSVILSSALHKLQWGENQKDWSTDLNSAECKAIIDLIANLAALEDAEMSGREGNHSIANTHGQTGIDGTKSEEAVHRIAQGGPSIEKAKPQEAVTLSPHLRERQPSPRCESILVSFPVELGGECRCERSEGHLGKHLNGGLWWSDSTARMFAEERA